MHAAIIEVATLAESINNPNWVIVDCRFSLNDPERGRRDYMQGHIPNAQYAHLDEDLSGQIVPEKTGRHPLPSIQELAEKFSQWGIDHTVQVVAYDDANGGVAARLWWLLRWLGHDAVAVLNGGWKAWQAANLPIDTTQPQRSRKNFQAHVRHSWTVDAAWVEKAMNHDKYCLIDAREPQRFAGVFEPIDPVAGHIPGAVNLPYLQNVDEDGKFKSVEALQIRFTEVISRRKMEHVAVYCGSGVTACHNLLAMVYAGFPIARLYPGSWSEWITNPDHPVATGDR
jgi:thiosulfate/3-mercaptopyruvate sulfurtransferase